MMTKRQPVHRRRARQRGMTLVELMVAMLIGTILIGGAITVFVQSRTNYRTADSIARLQENARYTLDLMEPDIRLAGFWGQNNQAWRIDPNGVTASCGGGQDGTEFAFRPVPVEMIDAVPDTAVMPCALDADHETGTDFLIVRHAGARDDTVPENGQAQVYGDFSGMTLFSDGVEPGGYGDLAHTRDVVVNAYYIARAADVDDGATTALPTLRRLSLVRSPGGPVFDDQEIMPGIEHMDIMLGVDTNADRQVDAWLDDMPADASARIMAVRMTLRIRSETDESGMGYVNPDYDDGFRRLTITRTIALRNMESA